ncbi:hypothetical protein EGT07_24210 [Herbaspirillum sp. HC18]|nr:hypothetical protein EGT07_24210 [Herbaspirillum sp. HC18]
MRFIPTTAVAVEKLKQQAKKTKSKLKIPHAHALDRVARGAGYNHWGHVTQCAAETARRADGPTLVKECEAIVAAALAGAGKLVITGPEIIDRPLILFSTTDGDAWLLEPNEGMVCALCWHGERLVAHVRDDGIHGEVNWDGHFTLAGDAFVVALDVPAIGDRSILGYPLRELRDAMRKVETFERGMGEVFGRRDALPLTDDLVTHLEQKGWTRENLDHARAAGAEYSPARDSLLFPVEVG